MKRYLLTDKRCKNAEPAGAGETLLNDGAGLYLRIRPAGKVWLLIQMRNGKKTKRSLGPYPRISLSDARKLAENPPEKTLNQPAPPVVTVASLLTDWAGTETRKDIETQKRRVEMYAAPLLPLPVVNVTKANIVTTLESTRGTGKTRTSGELFSTLKRVFDYAVDHELIVVNPMSPLKKSKYGNNGEEGERVFSVEEIPIFLTKIRQHLPVKYQQVLLMQLSCSTRIGETCLAEIQHFDMNACTWFIPAENNKSKRDFIVYLSDFALTVAKAAIAERTSGFLFCGRIPELPISPKTIMKTILDKQNGGLPRLNRPRDTSALQMPGGAWSSHDVRRTSSTLMRSAGVASNIVEECLNHVEDNRMKRIYHRHETAEEMRAAWSILSARLLDFEANIQESIR